MIPHVSLSGRQPHISSALIGPYRVQALGVHLGSIHTCDLLFDCDCYSHYIQEWVVHSFLQLQLRFLSPQRNIEHNRNRVINLNCEWTLKLFMWYCTGNLCGSCGRMNAAVDWRASRCAGAVGSPVSAIWAIVCGAPESSSWTAVRRDQIHFIIYYFSETLIVMSASFPQSATLDDLPP